MRQLCDSDRESDEIDPDMEAVLNVRWHVSSAEISAARLARWERERNRVDSSATVVATEISIVVGAYLPRMKASTDEEWTIAVNEAILAQDQRAIFLLPALRRIWSRKDWT